MKPKLPGLEAHSTVPVENLAPTGVRSPNGYDYILTKYYLFRAKFVTVLLGTFTFQQQILARNVYTL